MTEVSDLKEFQSPINGSTLLHDTTRIVNVADLTEFQSPINGSTLLHGPGGWDRYTDIESFNPL